MLQIMSKLALACLKLDTSCQKVLPNYCPTIPKDFPQLLFYKINLRILLLSQSYCKFLIDNCWGNVQMLILMNSTGELTRKSVI